MHLDSLRQDQAGNTYVQNDRPRSRSGSRQVTKPPPRGAASVAPFSRTVAAALGRDFANMWANKLSLDHLVYEVDSLAQACSIFEDITGVRPMRGGRHEVMGLHNAVVGLGEGRYLEFVAKIQKYEGTIGGPSAKVPVSVLGSRGAKPRLASFCCDAGCIGISRMVQELCKSPLKMYYPSEVLFQGGHCGDSSKMLTWRLAQDRHRDCIGGHLPMDGLVPFLIDWTKETRHLHPANIAPKGCELLELKGAHPQADDVAAILRLMRVDHVLTLESGTQAKLSAVIRHPRGELVLE